MAPNRGRNRASDFEESNAFAPQEFDPEADDIPNNSDESDDDLGRDSGEDDAREHYVDVGKSKLRKPKAVPLGPQYRGSRIGRDDLMDLEEDDEDDPFSRGFEEEDSEDEDIEDLEASVDNGSSVEHGDEDEEDEDILDDTSGTDFSEIEDGAVNPKSKKFLPGSNDNDDRQTLQNVVQEQRTVSTSLAEATKKDAEKGRAVKKQRATFDSLLNTRIKMQKTLVSTNTIVGTPDSDLQFQRQDATAAIEAAETAAFNLWSSLTNFREALQATKTGGKRKRPALTESTPTSDLWTYMQSQETATLPQRHKKLQFWHDKVRGDTVQPSSNLINKTTQQDTITDILQSHLSNQSRLLKRAHTPRSCAPLQLSQNIPQDEKIYDDADFYGLLLKELLEQKSTRDSIVAANVDYAAGVGRGVKVKKNVDTKASKGRKLRYTVHEKLQNFVAPEDRGSWGSRRTDELFGSLFGRRVDLGLRDDDAEGDDGIVGGVEEVDGEGDEGLVLFRS